MIEFGPTGKTVYERTYSRTKADGSKETWPETVHRVVKGNLGLVDPRYWEDREEAKLERLMLDFAVLPAGRHLWASGVKGRQYLFNCHTAGWTSKLEDHFTFTLLRLMEGGGVGSNYSSEFLTQYGPVQQKLEVHIVCNPSHPDYQEMKDAGLLSTRFSHEWDWPFQVQDSREGWADALADLLDAFMRPDTAHTCRVFDVSLVRPKGSPIKTFGGTASGPAPLARMLHEVAAVMNRRHGATLTPLDAMKIDHAIGKCVVAGGNRRSARMSMLPWNDPYIWDFIRCKVDGTSHWTTNISVVIDDEFIRLIKGVGSREDIEKANKILGAIAEGMLTNGEPGIWNRSLSQMGEVGEVYATNPCGEIALEPFENCNLGHINLSKFVQNGQFMYNEAADAARLMTRFLIRATFGDVQDPKQREILSRNRRIGVGLFGVQEGLALMGIRYSEAPNNKEFINILKFLKRVIRNAARDYAFQLRIPEPVKVTTVAPTGTIAKLPGTTEGIHPIFARYYIRRIRFSTINENEIRQLEEHKRQGYYVIPDPQAANTMIVEIPTKEIVVERVEAAGLPGDLVEEARELDLDQMLNFQATVQAHYADNAVSFTANIDPAKYTTEDLAETLRYFADKVKGFTIFPEKGFELAPYEHMTREEYEDWVARTGLDHVEDGVDEECANGACPIR